MNDVPSSEMCKTRDEVSPYTVYSLLFVSFNVVRLALLSCVPFKIRCHCDEGLESLVLTVPGDSKTFFPTVVNLALRNFDTQKCFLAPSQARY